MKTSNKLLTGFYGLGVLMVLTYLLVARANMVEPTKISRSGNITTMDKSIEPFTNLRINNRIHVKLIPNITPFMRVVTDDNLQEHFRLEQDGEHLELSIADDIKIANGGKIEVELGVQKLKDLTLSGSSHARSDSTLQVDFLNMRVHGGASVDLAVNAEQINVSTYGAGQTKLSGTVDFLDARTMGAAQLKASDLVADKVILDLSGATNAYVYPKQSLTVKASGASSIRYKGDPQHINKSLNGAAKLKKME